MGRTRVGAVCEGLYPIGEPHTGSGEQREEQGAAGTSCYGLTTTPTPRLDLQSIGGNEETAMKDCPHIWKTSITETALSLSVLVPPQFVSLWQISGPVSMPVATSCARASRVGV